MDYSRAAAVPLHSHNATHSAVLCGSACQSQTSNILQVKKSLGEQMGDFFAGLFHTNDWPARWHCGSWSDFHGWLYIVSDLLIWASYFAIPVLLIRMLTKRKDIPYPKIIWLFVAFIILCGTTHFLDAVIFWWPAYRLSALIRFFTGVVSAVTVYALYKVMPMVLSLRSLKELEAEIKERKTAELALTKSHELLFQSHQQLKTFTHILSHNIRNHSSNISLLTDLMDPSTLDENNADLFDKIVKVSNGLNTTLNDLSEAIKIRESTIEPELVDFRETAGKVVEILELEILSNGVYIKYDFNVETILYPKLYLESILMNLISNSIKYRKEESPQITLKTYTEGTHIVLECHDNGLGIDMDLHGTRLFGLYKTFHVNKNAHGVGLFLVKTQVESQGGSINVISQPGKGAVFKIQF
jgi:chemotaxis family two-component system sensor kinase Cph1